MGHVPKEITGQESDTDLTVTEREIAFAEFVQIKDRIDALLLPYHRWFAQYRQLENSDLIAHIDRVEVPIYTRAWKNCMHLIPLISYPLYLIHSIKQK